MADIARFSLSVPKSLLERLDSYRGMIPRSRLVAKVIEEFLERRGDSGE